MGPTIGDGPGRPVPRRRAVAARDAHTMAAAHVDNTTSELGRAWWPVALSTEVVEGVPTAVELLGSHWALVRTDGVVAAFADECPHRLLPISAGCVREREGRIVLQCAYHGWRFDTHDGRCVDIPSQEPGAAIPPRARLRTPFGVVERYGAVWLAPEEPVADLPAMDEWDDPTFEVRIDSPARTTAGAHQIMDNGCDTSHFAFVHAGTFGGDEAAITRAKSVERVGSTIVATYESTYQVLDDPDLAPGATAQNTRQTKIFVPGGSVLLRMAFPDASVFTILASAQPEHDGSTRLYRWWARNDIVGDEERWRACIAVEDEVQAEDMRALGAYRDHRLPLDLRREVHVADDRMSVAYRRLLAELVGSGD